MIELTSHGRPLATASNGDVWETFLEEGKLTLSHLPQSGALRSFDRLIRFYLSIEDGECQVERDLGVLSKFSAAHKNGQNELDDDLMLLKDDTIDGADIWISGQSTELGQASNSSRLGCKGRRWAELWRQVYGARLGIYNRKATEAKTKGGKRHGTYSAAKCGVLAAAEYVVELSKQESQDGSIQRTPFGVSNSFLQSAVGDKSASPYNNARLTKFQTLTTNKKYCRNHS